jgi:threonylcarbamoyladenosine tRNA methylthiotransferase MtaB
LKVAFKTLGCKLNFAESSAIANQFRAAGHQVANPSDHLDVLVINSCAVTDVAEKKCRAAIRHAKRVNPDAIIAVIGCFSQLRPEELVAMAEVDVVVGNEHKYNLVQILQDFSPNGISLVNHTNILKTKTFTPGHSLNDRTRTFLKIQDGCNHRCSYCTIPDARGRSRSGKISDMIDVIHDLDKQGVKEIVLTGVNIGDFGRPHQESLLMLLQRIADNPVQTRIRIGSVEPELLSNEIIRLVACTPHIMPHFHLPLQAGADRVLMEMRRKYNTALFRDRIDTIANFLPDACIACDVITGFPGETDEDFIQGAAFIESLPISYLHVFSYSERANTPAKEIFPKVNAATKKTRSAHLQHLSGVKKAEFYHRCEGSVREVLFESDRHGDVIGGFTDNYIRVKHPWHSELVNRVVPVTLDRLDEDGIMIATVSSFM